MQKIAESCGGQAALQYDHDYDKIRHRDPSACPWQQMFFWKLLSHHVSLGEFLPIVIAFEFWVNLLSATTHPTSLNKFIMLIMCIFVLKPLFILGVYTWCLGKHHE